MYNEPGAVDPRSAALMQPGADVMGAGPMPPAAPGGQLDPALVQQMLMLQGQGAGMDKAKRQMMMADKLRAAAPGMARSQSPINTPNWAGALAQAVAGYKANQMDQAAQNDMARMGNERIAAYNKYMQGLSGVTPTPDPAAGGALPGDY